MKLKHKKKSARARRHGPWQLQTAKAQFSEVFRLACSKGPQRVTRQGKQAVIILSEEQFEKLRCRQAGPKRLTDFFAQSPLAGSGISWERPRDTGRDISL